MQKLSKKIALGTTILTVFIFGAFTNWAISKSTSDDESFKRCSDEYNFLSNELDCGTINEKIEQVNDIDNMIEKMINEAEQNGRIEKASVFFRDLNSRRWFGVNENVNFYPASLAKLPIAMMTYKSSEINKKILDTELEITEDDVALNNGQHYHPAKSLEVNNFYSVRELLKNMLTYSDNAPVNPLLNASKLFHQEIFTDLGVYYPSEQANSEGQWNITTKTYANLFRSLYNSSYLKPEYSNEILRMLSESPFKKALAGGVPENVTIAHKYGETSYEDKESGKNLTVLNDCGIIYKKDSPYILCVMTLGKDYNELENLIKNISYTVYEN